MSIATLPDGPLQLGREEAFLDTPGPLDDTLRLEKREREMERQKAELDMSADDDVEDELRISLGAATIGPSEALVEHDARVHRCLHVLRARDVRHPTLPSRPRLPCSRPAVLTEPPHYPCQTKTKSGKAPQRPRRRRR